MEPTHLERRFTALEASFLAIDKTLAVIAEQLKHVALREDVQGLRTEFAALAGRVDRMASATELAELKGRVARIPTVPTLTSILVFVSLLFAGASWALRHLPPEWSRALQ